jgi:hypothetical protein
MQKIPNKCRRSKTKIPISYSVRLVAEACHMKSEAAVLAQIVAELRVLMCAGESGWMDGWRGREKGVREREEIEGDKREGKIESE